LVDHQRKVIKEIEGTHIDNPRQYWKLLKKLSRRKAKKNVWDTVLNKEGEEVSGDRIKMVWKDAYKAIGDKNLDRADFDNEYEKIVDEEVMQMHTRSLIHQEDELGRPISLEEVKSITHELQNGKAAGVDGIVNEIIKYGGDKMNVIIWKLCNTIFDKEVVPKDWQRGIIFPIFKDGDRRRPLNYRGITLLSAVSKVYTSILNDRLANWCEKKKIIIEEQGGFRKGRGCIDQIFVLTGILRKRHNQQTYCCFVDLTKAFDRVWRNGLWKALWEEGIRGKMWRVLRSIYSNTESKILLGQAETDYFNFDTGVRQGCVVANSILYFY